MNESKRARHWNIKTYKSTNEILNLVKGTECIYRFINHNKDTFDDSGELKKEHTHIVLSFKNARTGNSIYNFLELESNAYVAPCKSLRQSIRYLIHADDIKKSSYSKDEIIHNDPKIDNYFIEEESDTEKVENIYNDVKAYVLKEINLKEFLMLHPEFIYRMYNFRALANLISAELGLYNNNDDNIPF